MQVEEILENDEEPIEGGTDDKHLTEVKRLQSQNAPFPMEVTLFGMLTDVKPLQ